MEELPEPFWLMNGRLREINLKPILWKMGNLGQMKRR